MYSMFAATTKPGTAELLFLIAMIVFIVAAVVAWVVTPRAIVQTLACTGLAVLALGFYLS